MKAHNNTIENEEFPGYPHYPSNEDIMNRAERVTIDTDGLPEVDKNEPLNSTLITEEIKNSLNNADGSDQVPSEDDDVIQQQQMETEDDALRDRVYPVDFTGNNLDVPGSELDDENEATGNEDEENNSYSLGNLD